MLPLDARRTPGPAAPPHPYLETTTLIQRANRRLLDMVENALRREGCTDITVHQAMTMYNIGDGELTAGEVRTRDCYLATNQTYTLKKLHRMGMIEARRSETDQRVVHIKLTDAGCHIRDIVEDLYGKHVRTVEHLGGVSAQEFAALNKALHRLERFWRDQVRYQL